MNKFMETEKKIEKAVVSGYKAIEDGVVGGYKKIEDGVVGGYKKIENGFVDGYKKIENKFVEAFLTPDDAIDQTEYSVDTDDSNLIKGSEFDE